MCQVPVRVEGSEAAGDVLSASLKLKTELLLLLLLLLLLDLVRQLLRLPLLLLLVLVFDRQLLFITTGQDFFFTLSSGVGVLYIYL